MSDQKRAKDAQDARATAAMQILLEHRIALTCKLHGEAFLADTDTYASLDFADEDWARGERHGYENLEDLYNALYREIADLPVKCLACSNADG